MITCPRTYQNHQTAVEIINRKKGENSTCWICDLLRRIFLFNISGGQYSGRIGGEDIGNRDMHVWRTGVKALEEVVFNSIYLL